MYVNKNIVLKATLRKWLDLELTGEELRNFLFRAAEGKAAQAHAAIVIRHIGWVISLDHPLHLGPIHFENCTCKQRVRCT